ncbi:MAG: hypothetical protein ACQKBV_13670 [Puniceicoccales bacterium]
MSPKLIRLVVVIFFLLAIGIGLWLWRDYSLERMRQQTEADLATAWEAGDFSRVRLLSEHLPEAESREAWQEKLQEAQLTQAVARSDAFTLRQIRGNAIAAQNEDEALLLARAAVHERDPKTYEAISAEWMSQSSDEASWVFLEADALIVMGKISEARELLERKRFTGKAESNRLLRLSLLSTNNPRDVLRLIDEATVAAPDNADALAFRGQIFESLGQWQASRADYVRAVTLEPGSPLFWDQLGEFYRRRQQYAMAVDSWLDGYQQTNVAEFWIKAWFWKQITGLGRMLPPAPRGGPFAEYAQYLSNLPNGTWWDSDQFETLPYASRIAQQRQETYWLRLLQALQDNDEAQALMLLRSDPFAKRTWSPRLKAALQSILLFRSSEPAPPAPILNDPNQHQFYRKLHTIDDSLSPEMTAILNSSNAWSAAFLAEGWLEAALVFDTPDDAQPAWYDYGLVQILRQTDTIDAALARLNQSDSDDPNLQLLKAELQWLNNDPASAETTARALLSDSGAAGQRAAMLLALHYAKNNQWDAVEELTNTQNDWAASIQGKEMAARLALAKADLAQATSIYEGIVDDSMEAKLFLSRLAFQNEEWTQARELTQALITENPDEPAFYRNLQAINQAEANP